MCRYEAGERDATLIVESDDGVERLVPMEAFFREDALPPLEDFALSLCRSPVLDVGAGTGAHAARLAEAGHAVVAIDVLEEAVAVMRARGVADARTSTFDAYAATGERTAGTILMLMNGIGIVGRLDALPAFFRAAERILVPGGQLLLDSTDVRAVPDEAVRAAADRRESAGTFAGEVTYRLRFEERLGTPYPWLFVDPDTLRRHAERCGWVVQVVFEDEEGQYLARLCPVRSAHQ